MRIKQAWVEFSDDILMDVSSVQFTETRRAFYAGAFAVMVETLEITELEDEEAVKALSGMRAECVEFLDQLKQGKK